METSNQLRPGERLFALLLVLVAGFVFAEAHAISGFRGLTTGGVMPMLAAGVMLLSSLLILADTLRKPRNGSGIQALIAYLLPLRVVLFAGLVTVYAALIPGLGFLAASGAFLFVAIWGLWRRGPVLAAALSTLSILAIYLLFRVVFQVVLPLGSLWQTGKLWS
ncbi:tripartite tricarboxylate transporter TctB family protein [Denitrobaculum tricleocarpae]|uniref:Tripartite tricarboxylate transporter TctB family protein n=1 Tax=Denitrobaculum tricleocarpae TaxID=2591009 RepID=A0A545TYB4_9PROT|nr:tripartite tricarboxylate transporter TctB family protein [Denitrobaculum tricleocarpae]TQV82184.1 tripartite tricarboxylate transporter TctB family protein [Denitrobaculum tricleocarpae]